MKRAAVLVGVDATGGLPRLSDAAAGAERMEAWALAQGLARKDVVLLTDRNGPVELAAIKKAIRALVDRGTVEQLLVYFAGHGVLIARGEYWLLSGAPEDAGEAVNASGSATAALFCGIPHVVFVSDCCRTAAAGLRAQSIQGGEIFPNQVSPDAPDASVDWFYATTVGTPALELRADGSAGTDFRAIYTATLLDALNGRLADALGSAAAGSKPAFVVRPWPLSRALAAELPRRLAGLDLGSGVTQKPKAVISSDPDAAWLAGFDARPDAVAAAASGSAPATRSGRRPVGADARHADDAGDAGAGDAGAGGAGARDAGAGDAGAGDAADSRPPPAAAAAARTRTSSPPHPPTSAATVGAAAVLAAQDALESAFRDAVLHPFAAPVAAPPTAVFRRTRGAGAAAPPPARPAPPTPPGAQPFGPMNFETRRGFKVRGGTVERATASAGLDLEVFADDRSVVRAAGRGDPDATGLVLLEFADGTGIVLPAVPEWIVAVDLIDGEVANVAWEPSENTWRHAGFAARADEIRALRAVVAEAAREGVFELDRETARALAPRMQSVKSVDPALGLYAAYAFHRIRDEAALQRMARALPDDLGVSLFDLDLLARRVAAAPADARRLPPFPLLQQGWNLLAALGAPLPPALAPLRGELVDALWTQFTPAGVARLRALLAKGSLP